jgi:hypothetical protein
MTIIRKGPPLRAADRWAFPSGRTPRMMGEDRFLSRSRQERVVRPIPFVLVAMLVAATRAHAALVGIDAGSFPEGSVVTDVGNGARLGLVTTRRYEFSVPPAPGVAVVNRQLGRDLGASGVGSGPFTYMRVDFAAPTGFVAVTGTTGTDVTTLWAFDATGAQVGRCSVWVPTPNVAAFPPFQSGCATYFGTPPSQGSGDRWIGLEVAQRRADIAYVIFGADWDLGLGASLRTLRFEVPEPGSLALLAIPLGALALGRRSHRRAAG